MNSRESIVRITLLCLLLYAAASLASTGRDMRRAEAEQRALFTRLTKLQDENALMRRFYEAVSAIEGITVYGDFETPRTAVVTINIGDEDSSVISDVLFEDYEIATRPGAHCAPRMHEALGTTEQGAVRFSFSWFNTEADVDAAIQAVRELA